MSLKEINQLRRSEKQLGLLKYVEKIGFEDYMIELKKSIRKLKTKLGLNAKKV